jgi:hypothetical protein
MKKEAALVAKNLLYLYMRLGQKLAQGNLVVNHKNYISIIFFYYGLFKITWPIGSRFRSDEKTGTNKGRRKASGTGKGLEDILQAFSCVCK